MTWDCFALGIPKTLPGVMGILSGDAAWGWGRQALLWSEMAW